MQTKDFYQGFTLVELIAVILLIGIVSVVVLPRFFSRDGFSDYALRDQLISSYRFVQQRAMYDHSGVCYSLSITSAGFEPQRDGAFFGNFGQVGFVGDYAGLSVSPSPPITLFFDGLGNTFRDDCGVTPVAAPFLTLMVGEAGLEIYPSGFIKAI